MYNEVGSDSERKDVLMKQLLTALALAVFPMTAGFAATDDKTLVPEPNQDAILKEIDRQIGEDMRELQQLARERRTEELTRPINRLPSVYYKPVLATREEPFAVLGRCNSESTCADMEAELKAIRAMVCRTVVVLLDAQLNQGYASPTEVYGSTGSIVFLQRPHLHGAYEYMNPQPQPSTDLRAMTCR